MRILKISGLPYFLAFLCCLAAPAWAQAPDPAPGGDEESLARVREIIAQARSAGTAADPNEASTQVIVTGLRNLGESGVPGALALLSARAEEPRVLAALLKGLAESAGLGDDRVCVMVRRYLAVGADMEAQEPLWAALASLKSWRAECTAGVEELARLFVMTADSELRFEIIEVLSWIGQTSEHVRVVRGLTAGPVSDCERRLLAAAILRIRDRFIAPDR